jgi:hypothetical protein
MLRVAVLPVPGSGGYRMASVAIRQNASLIGEPAPQEGRHWLNPEWTVLPAEALPGLPRGTHSGKRRFVLLHPVRGLAILDLWSPAEVAREAVPESLDAELELAGFLRRLDPRLPALRIHLAEAALPSLAKVLARTYAGTGPLELPEGDAWIAAVQTSLAAPAPTVTTALPRHLARRHHLAAGLAVLAMLAAFGQFSGDGQIVAEDMQPSSAAAPAIAALEQAASEQNEARAVPLADADPEPTITEAASAAPAPEPDDAALPLAVASREGVAAEALPEPAPPSPASAAAPPAATPLAAAPPRAAVPARRRTGIGTLLKPFGRPIPAIREVRPSRFFPQEQKPPPAQRR